MLMHAPGAVEVEDVPEEEPLQGIDARRPLQIQAYLTCPLEIEDAAPLHCQIAERWRDKELVSLPEAGRVAGEGGEEKMAPSCCRIEEPWRVDGAGAVRLNAQPGGQKSWRYEMTDRPPSEAVRGLACVSQQCGYFVCIPRQAGEALCYRACDMMIPDRPPREAVGVVSRSCGSLVREIDKLQSSVRRRHRRGPVDRQDLGRKEGGRRQCERRGTDIRRSGGLHRWPTRSEEASSVEDWLIDSRLGASSVEAEKSTIVGHRLCRYRPPTGRIVESIERQKFS
eukprot:Gb_25635 [translate_table: standard]